MIYSITPEVPDIPIDLVAGDRVEIHPGQYTNTTLVDIHGSEDEPIEVVVLFPQYTHIDPEQKIAAKDRWTEFSQHVFSTVLEADEFPDQTSFTSLVMNDLVPYILVGPDPVYDDSWRHNFGEDEGDVAYGQFFYKDSTRELFVGQSSPKYVSWSLGQSREFKFRMKDCSWVNVSGIRVRGPNRMTAQQWGASSVSDCVDCILDDCVFLHGDHKCFTLGRSERVTLTGCTFAQGGSSGATMSLNVNCTFLGCTFADNGYRQFKGKGIMGGMKAIPGNTGCEFIDCVFTRNQEHGLWFDSDNQNCVSRNNVCSYNNGEGLRFERDTSDCLSTGDRLFCNAKRGLYVNNRVKNLTVLDAFIVNNRDGLMIDPRDNEKADIRGCFFANNQTYDIGLRTDQKHKCDENYYTENARFLNPWSNGVSREDWQASGFDRHSTFQNTNYELI